MSYAIQGGPDGTYHEPDLGWSANDPSGKSRQLPYGFIDIDHGFHAGVGLGGGNFTNHPGQDETLDNLIGGSFDIGSWTADDGERDHGVELDAGVIDFEAQPEPGQAGNLFNLDFLSGNAGATAGDGDFRLGAEASGLELAFGHDTGTSGWSGGFGVGTASGGVSLEDGTFEIGAAANASEIFGEYHTADQNSKDDWSVGGGFSAGPSLGLRLHHNDADGDGLAETGLGFDFGCVSFDAKSEALTRNLANLGNIPGDLLEIAETGFWPDWAQFAR